MKERVGIIGGTGGMGSLFARFFKSQGHRVQVASRHTYLSPEACAATSDWVVVSVPIATTAQVIEKIGPYLNPKSVLMDLTSLKVMPVKAMAAVHQGEVIGLHPVFGPRVRTLRSQVLVMTPLGKSPTAPRLRKMFESAGAKVQMATAADHDRIMAVVQGLMHLTSIQLLQTLSSLKANPKKLRAFSSPVYRVRLDFAARILAQDPEMYADIALGNPETLKVLTAYRRQAEVLESLVRRKDRKGFLKLFAGARDYLGPEAEASQGRTDRLLNTLAHLEKG